MDVVGSKREVGQAMESGINTRRVWSRQIVKHLTILAQLRLVRLVPYVDCG